MIHGNPALQEQFADIDVLSRSLPKTDRLTNGDSKAAEPQKINVIEALLKSTLEQGPVYVLDARLAACECIKAFVSNHPGIRVHFLRRAIDGHASGEDQIPNILSILLQDPDNRGNSDPYQSWLASVLLFHLLFEDTETKALAMKVTEGDESSGEEVITCIQSITGNLITSMQRNDDKRIAVGYLMLLCGWLFEDPDAVNDFLGEGSSIQSLIQEINQCLSSKILLPGLCAVLLGIIYEFSSKDSPIPRTTLHQLLTNRLGREQYIDKITKLRELHAVRDFEVLPQTAQGEYDDGLPEVFFDRTFVDFLKDNFSRLTRAIDREPGLEIPVVANGIQKGISRELVDSLRAQLEDRGQGIQKLESDIVNLERKLEQEHLDHRKTREACEFDLTRLRQVNDTLQKNHQNEFARLQNEHKRAEQDLIKQHSEQLQLVESQSKKTITTYEQNSNKAREQHGAEVEDLRKTIRGLESALEKAGKDHSKSLHEARDEFTSQLSASDARSRQAEERANNTEKRVAEAKREIENLEGNAQKLKTQHSEDEKALKEAQQERDSLRKKLEKSETKNTESEKALKEVQQELDGLRKKLEKSETQNTESEKARKATQGELDDLLIVFGDLEAKRNEDKVRIYEQMMLTDY